MTFQKMRYFSSYFIGLEMIHLNRIGSRVFNFSPCEGDASRLLGYVEVVKSDHDEVPWLATSINWADVESFELAPPAVADRPHFSNIVEPERDPATRARITAVFPLVRRCERGVSTQHRQWQSCDQ